MLRIDSDIGRLFRSLQISLMEYESRNGHKPGVIFAESGAFYLLEFRNENVLQGDLLKFRGKRTIFGIPVKEIMATGYGIYLSDGPIQLKNSDGIEPDNVKYYDLTDKEELLRQIHNSSTDDPTGGMDPFGELAHRCAADIVENATSIRVPCNLVDFDQVK